MSCNQVTNDVSICFSSAAAAVITAASMTLFLEAKSLIRNSSLAYRSSQESFLSPWQTALQLWGAPHKMGRRMLMQIECHQLQMFCTTAGPTLAAQSSSSATQGS